MHGNGILRIIIIIAALSLLLDWYVFSGLRTFSDHWRSVPLRRLITLGYLVISVGVTLVFILGLGSLKSARGMTPFHEWMLSLFLTFFVTKLFFVIVLSLGDLGRFIYGLATNI